MNGLLRRLKRRAATADETPPDTPAASEPVDATATNLTVEGGPELSEEDRARIEAERAREEELKRRRRDLPAGLDAAELEAVPGEDSRRGQPAAGSATCGASARCCCATSAASPTRSTAPPAAASTVATARSSSARPAGWPRSTPS